MVLFYSKLFMKAMKIGLKSKLRGKAVRPGWLHLLSSIFSLKNWMIFSCKPDVQRAER